MTKLSGRNALAVLLIMAGALFVSPLFAEEPQDCIFKDNRGIIKITDSMDKVPVEYRATAQCRAATKSGNVRPNQIELEGNTRSVSMASPIGRIELRWPRSVERIFGRTPERALADAAKTASRALKSGGFSTHISNVDIAWRIIFLDQNLPERQIPMQIVSQCHPGWMYPPSDIFIVAQRVAAGCGGDEDLDSGNADRALSRVLLHELGHGIEFALLQGRGGSDSFRAEGFASWFESYASRYSEIIPRGSVAADYAALGLGALNQGMTGFSYSGSPYDYGLSFLQMKMLEERRGVSGLMRLYESRISRGEGFSEAFRDDIGMRDNKLRETLAKLGQELASN